VRGATRQILRNCGYTVLEATNGLEAIALAEANPRIDLLVSDVVMPYMGGRELAERIVVLCPGCKVLLMSGYTDDVVLRHGVMEAAFAFLQKPFTQAILTQKVRAVLEEGKAPKM
jgi:CheY-like chemotaxis protein